MEQINTPIYYCGDELQEWKLNRINKVLEEKKLDAILFTKHDAVRYVTGFYTKGYRPFIDFDYLAIVPAGNDPIIGYSLGGEDRRIAIRSKVSDSRKLPSLYQWHEVIVNILKDYKLDNGRIGFDILPHFMYEGIKNLLPNISLVDASGIWSDVTAIKHPIEVKLIREALRIAQTGMDSAIKALKPGKKENEISAVGEYTMRTMGSEMNAFIPVISSGPNSAIWERVATERVIQNNEMVILDFGSVYKGYTGDFARTTVTGEPSKKQRQLYRVAYESLHEAIKAVKPGILCSDIDKIARKVIEDAGMGKYQHLWASGHQLGYGLHGSPTIGPTVDVPLLAGMVINIEPSLYTYDDLSVGGVEIEDTILVTETGYEKLTNFPYDEELLR
jgi:Xaa-Pro aminopeptidase